MGLVAGGDRRMRGKDAGSAHTVIDRRVSVATEDAASRRLARFRRHSSHFGTSS
jgi:hypothetical protein